MHPKHIDAGGTVGYRPTSPFPPPFAAYPTCQLPTLMRPTTLADGFGLRRCCAKASRVNLAHQMGNYLVTTNKPRDQSAKSRSSRETGLRPESCWNDCLTRRKSIRPCVPSHVAYEVGAARQQTVRSPRTMYPHSQEWHRSRKATVYLPA